MLFKGEYGTDNAIDGKTLDQIFNSTPDEVLQNDFLKYKLVHFILTYGRCAANREHILKLMKREQRECYITDPEEEKKNAFRCFCDFLTKSDLAFVRYQFDNCEPDWLIKRANPENKVAQYGCKTKHTSGQRAERRQGGSVTTPVGMEIYNKAMKFFVDLKKNPNYDMFQRYCNNRSKAYGILRVWKDAAPKTDLELSDDDEDELQVVVPKFDIGDDDICAGFAAV